MKHPFHSAMASQFEAFVQSRKAERRWSNVYDDNLHFFDNYCAEHYPNQATLCEGMLDGAMKDLQNMGTHASIGYQQ